MPQYNLLDLATVVRSLGRGVVMYATSDQAGTIPASWNPTQPLYLQHLGDTEGDIEIETNPQMDALTTPELTGGAAHEMDYSGEGPEITIPLYLADPALEAIVSPFGLASAGLSRRAIAAEHTLVIFPEGLFVTAAPGVAPAAAELAVSAGAWTLGGQALTSAQLAQLGQAFFAWRGWFTRPRKRFLGGAGDARKNIEPVTFRLGHHPDMPEGHHLYTIGNPYDASINLEGGS